MPQRRIESIADHPDLVEVVAAWHWNEWGQMHPEGSLVSWAAGLRERTNWEAIPTTYVAFEGAELVGSVTLVEFDMDTRRDLSPWLAGLFVAPAHRGRGVGSALARHAVHAAAAMGFERLYLYTSNACEMYERLGWRTIAHEGYVGEQVVVMAIDTGADQNG